ncbi:hypothetical protein L1987_65657 [Smallanthus sonchifolius]|uniref:Uncharacterized protein n=1 Tax=Smallanthus sonchifolius TaxID=185202 RepID=A0ACB9BV33_9ASTR|nr:hypothetical protein L1987_65657 [Smallanthus sonchifolius]
MICKFEQRIMYTFFKDFWSYVDQNKTESERQLPSTLSLSSSREFDHSINNQTAKRYTYKYVYVSTGFGYLIHLQIYLNPTCLCSNFFRSPSLSFGTGN